MNRELVDAILRDPRRPRLPAEVVALCAGDGAVEPSPAACGEARDVSRVHTVIEELLAGNGAGEQRAEAILTGGVAAWESLLPWCRDALGDQFDEAEAWARGIVAWNLLQRVNPQQSATGFVAGLFLNIGIVAIASTFGSRYLTVLQKADGDCSRLTDLEVTDCDIRHADVGALVLSAWGMPQAMVTLVKYHDAPSAAPREARAAALALWAGRELTSWHDQPRAQVAEDRVARATQASLGVDRADLGALTQRARRLAHVWSGTTCRCAAASSTNISGLSEAEGAGTSQPAPLTSLVRGCEDRDPITGLPTGPALLNRVSGELETIGDNSSTLGLLMLCRAGPPGTRAGHHDELDLFAMTVVSCLRRHLAPFAGEFFRVSDDCLVALVPGVSRVQLLAHAERCHADLLARMSTASGAALGVRGGAILLDAGNAGFFGGGEDVLAALERAQSRGSEGVGPGIGVYVPRAA